MVAFTNRGPIAMLILAIGSPPRFLRICCALPAGFPESLSSVALKVAAHTSEAAGSLRSPAAFLMERRSFL
jgi:hypothetical protein